jgi:hypothetical protein
VYLCLPTQTHSCRHVSPSELLSGFRLKLVLRNYTNKNVWEELIAYFPFTVIVVSDTTYRKKTLVCMRNEVNKAIQVWRLQCRYYGWEWFMEYTVEIISDGILTKFHDDRFLNSSNIKDVTSRIWEAVMLVLLIRGILITSLSWLHVARTKFHEDWYTRSSKY